MDKTDKFFWKAIKKQHSIVKANFNKEKLLKTKEWYSGHYWNEKQRNDFKKWFIENYAKEFRTNKRITAIEYAWFNLMYGWVDAENFVLQCPSCGKKMKHHKNYCPEVSKGGGHLWDECFCFVHSCYDDKQLNEEDNYWNYTQVR